MNMLKVYEDWLNRSGEEHSYSERIGALAMLLWLHKHKLLKDD